MKFKKGDRVVVLDKSLSKPLRGEVVASNNSLTSVYLDTEPSKYPFPTETKNVTLEELYDSPFMKALR